MEVQNQQAFMVISQTTLLNNQSMLMEHFLNMQIKMDSFEATQQENTLAPQISFSSTTSSSRIQYVMQMGFGVFGVYDFLWLFMVFVAFCIFDGHPYVITDTLSSVFKWFGLHGYGVTWLICVP